MAEIINLRSKRKDRARENRQKTAGDNRIKYGRTKAEKQLARSESELQDRRLSGHKLSDEDA